MMKLAGLPPRLIGRQAQACRLHFFSSRLVGWLASSLNGSLSPKASPQISLRNLTRHSPHPPFRHLHSPLYQYQGTRTPCAVRFASRSTLRPRRLLYHRFPSSYRSPPPATNWPRLLYQQRAAYRSLQRPAQGRPLHRRIGTDCSPVSIGLLLPSRAKFEKAIHSRSRQSETLTAVPLIRSSTPRTLYQLSGASPCTLAAFDRFTMATQFSTATAIPQQHAPYQHHAYRKSAQYSPDGSALNTPMNISPTSPRTTSTQLPLQRHQSIYQPRTAIGIPAALRKTERPGSKSPPKPDSGVGSANSGWQVNGRLPQVATDGNATPNSQVGNEDMIGIYNDAPLSPTAGPITRNHWQADGSTSVCSASSCHEPFGFFQRRHHCRKCGGVFCWQHSSKQVRLDELARFHPDGAFHRACDRCHGSFREWEHLRSSRTNSESSDNSAAAIEIEPPAPAKRPENPRVGSIAQSFQGAWHWSTF